MSIYRLNKCVANTDPSVLLPHDKRGYDRTKCGDAPKHNILCFSVNTSAHYTMLYQ